ERPRARDSREEDHSGPPADEHEKLPRAPRRGGEVHEAGEAQRDRDDEERIPRREEGVLVREVIGGDREPAQERKDRSASRPAAFLTAGDQEESGRDRGGAS